MEDFSFFLFFWSRFIISAFVESAAKEKRRKVIREKNHLGLSLIKAFMIGLWEMTYRSWYFIFGLVPTVSTSRYNQVKYLGLFSLKILSYCLMHQNDFKSSLTKPKCWMKYHLTTFGEYLTFLKLAYSVQNQLTM